MIYEYAWLTVEAGNTAEFDSRIPAAQQILSSSPGCSGMEMLKSVDEPGVYLMRVAWERVEDHLETFADSPAAKELGGLIGVLFASPPVVAHFGER